MLGNVDEVKRRLFGYRNLVLTLSGHKHLDHVGWSGSVRVIATPGFIVPQEVRVMKNDSPSTPTENVPSASPESPRKPTPKWPIFLLLAAAVIVPAMFWQRVWLGVHLSDDEIRRLLSQPENPRDVQHACEQISRRMQRDPQDAQQFYGLLVSLADHSDEQIRYVAAWCMGEDNTRHPPLHQALLRLASDEAPRVRYNAALGLVRRGDPAARSVLREMLLPCPVVADWKGLSSAGTVLDVLRKGDPVKPQMQLALVDTGAGDPEPVLAPLGGRVGEVWVVRGASVNSGEPICTIEPTFQQAYEALRALALVGEADDLPYVEPYFNADNRFSDGQRARLQAQTQLAAEAIRRRDALLHADIEPQVRQ